MELTKDCVILVILKITCLFNFGGIMRELLYLIIYFIIESTKKNH
jgi:hypothetical protein